VKKEEKKGGKLVPERWRLNHSITRMRGKKSVVEDKEGRTRGGVKSPNATGKAGTGAEKMQESTEIRRQKATPPSRKNKQRNRWEYSEGEGEDTARRQKEMTLYGEGGKGRQAVLVRGARNGP